MTPHFVVLHNIGMVELRQCACLLQGASALAVIQGIDVNLLYDDDLTIVEPSGSVNSSKGALPNDALQAVVIRNRGIAHNVIDSQGSDQHRIHSCTKKSRP
jgi:hypothetical protein